MFTEAAENESGQPQASFLLAAVEKQLATMNQTVHFANDHLVTLKRHIEKEQNEKKEIITESEQAQQEVVDCQADLLVCKGLTEDANCLGDYNFADLKWGRFFSANPLTASLLMAPPAIAFVTGLSLALVICCCCNWTACRQVSLINIHFIKLILSR